MLDQLLDSGFSTRQIERIETMIVELGELETESDVKQIEIRSALFELEKDMNPVDVMFLYRVLEWIGDVADHAQTVGNRMLYVIAR
jgi:predicted phosphate transport protein (TIGR00153 family)